MINPLFYYGIYSAFAVILIIIVYAKIDIEVINCRKEFIDCLIVVVLAIIIGVIAYIRPYDSADTANYLGVYTSAKDPGFYIKDFFIYGQRVYGIETSFVLIVAVLKALTLSFRQVLFIIAFANAVLILTSSVRISELLYRNQDKAKMYALFVSYFGMHYCCIAIRAGLSLGIGLAALSLFMSKKPLRGAVILYCSLLLHSMSVLFVPIIAIMIFKKDREIELYGQNNSGWFITAYTACVGSLLVNFGSKLADAAISFFEFLSSRFGITSFAGYMVGIDRAVGIKDWFMIIAIGMMLMSVRNKTVMIRNARWVVMIGLLIISIFYPIRAVNRAADYFFLMSLPLISTVIPKEEFPKGSVFTEFLIYPMLLAVQFKL